MMLSEKRYRVPPHTHQCIKKPLLCAFEKTQNTEKVLAMTCHPFLSLSKRKLIPQGPFKQKIKIKIFESP